MSLKYDSSNWEIDNSDFVEKIHSFESLHSQGLPHLNYYVFSYDEICSLSQKNCKFDVKQLVMAYEKNTNDRDGFFDIEDFCSLKNRIDSRFDIPNKENQEIICVSVDEMENFEGCFTGIIISDGKGNLFCEMLSDTIDNRELTRISGDYNRFDHIRYRDYELVDCSDFLKFKILKKQIDKCILIKGYFEFSYCLVHATKEIKFCHFSSNDNYQRSINSDDLSFQNYIHTRILKNLI